MKRPKRVKLIRQALINKLATYERRIRQMSENHYKIRQFLEALDQQEKDDAIRWNAESVGLGSTEDNAG